MADKDLKAAVGEITTWDTALQKAESAQAEAMRARVRALVTWAGMDEHLADVESRLQTCYEKLTKGEIKEARACLEERLPLALPEGGARLRTLADDGRGLVKLASDLSVDATNLSRALEEVPKANPLSIDRVGDGILGARRQLESELRKRAEERVRDLTSFIDTLKEEGADLADGVGSLQEVLSQLPSSPLEDLKGLVGRANGAVEGPTMSVVAAYIDEVRPRLVEARQLGRNASPALDEVNRAREAYRTKDYRLAVRSAQKALEIVSELVADMEAAHEEVNEFKQLLARLSGGGLSATPFEEFVRQAEASLRKNEVEKMRAALQEGLRVVGRESLPFFRNQLDVQKRVLARLDERNWSSPELGEKLKEVRKHFQEGQFAETAEALAAYKTALRAVVAPHLSHRLEELGKAVEEIPDTESVAGVRRLMAETDVAFKVKEDVDAALENLAKTEKELAVTFAARASSLVDELEDERKGLGEMGIETATLEKEIAQIHQIFDLGDFLKASRASRELKARILQQQLLRAEEEVSKAKLTLVELAKMGLEPAALKTGLIDSMERVRSGRYPGAYQRASQVRKEAVDLKTTAQKVREEIGALAEMVAGLRKQGLATEELQPVLPKARQASEAYQKMDFDRALGLTAELKAALQAIAEKREAGRGVGDLEALLAAGKQVGIVDPTWETDLKQVKDDLAAGKTGPAAATMRTLRPRLIEGVRSGLDGQLKTLESDLKAARAAGLDTGSVEPAMAEARRKLAEPVPLGVAELIDRSRRDFFQSRTFLEQALKAVEGAREAVNKAELVRATTTGLRPLIKEMDAKLTVGDHAAALEIAQRISKEADEGIRAQVQKNLASFQAMINHAKIEGANTAVAENLLVQARNLLTAGKALEALNLATKSETELERVELQHSLATNALLTIKGKLDDAKEQGIRAPDVEREVARAEDMISRGDYAGVLERTMEGGDLLLRASENRRRTSELVEATGKLLDAMGDLGIAESVAQMKGDNDKARHLIDEGEYSKAQALARETSEGARGAVAKVLESRRLELRGLLDIVRERDPDHVGDFEPVVKKAEESLRSRDWKATLGELQEARRTLEKIVARLLTSDREKLTVQWKAVPPVDEADRQARAKTERELEAARDRGDLLTYRTLLEGALSEAQGLRRRQLDREVAELESRVLLGERLGVDMTPVMEALSEIKMNMKSGSVDPLLAQISKTEEGLAKLLSTRLTDRTTELAGETAFARDGLGMEVGAVETSLAGVELLQAGGDVVAAARKLVEAETELAKRKELHWQLTNTQYMIDQKLATLSDRKVELGPVRELVAEANRARQTDYAKALELSQRALDELRRLLNEGVPSEARTTPPDPAAVGANPGGRGGG